MLCICYQKTWWYLHATTCSKIVMILLMISNTVFWMIQGLKDLQWWPYPWTDSWKWKQSDLCLTWKQKPPQQSLRGYEHLGWGTEVPFCLFLRALLDVRTAMHPTCGHQCHLGSDQLTPVGPLWGQCKLDWSSKEQCKPSRWEWGWDSECGLKPDTSSQTALWSGSGWAVPSFFKKS